MVKKSKNWLMMQAAVLLLVLVFIAGACSDEDPTGQQTGIETPKVFDELADLGMPSIAAANVLTLGLQPGKDTTKVNLNWYSPGDPSNKVAKVMFVRGTLVEAYELLKEEDNSVAPASTGFTQHKATITGLQAGASYQYVVSSDGTHWTDAYNFTVPRDTGAWKFAVIADPQLTTGNVDANSRYPSTDTTTAAGWVETMGKIMTKGVSFIASGGDQVDRGAGSEQEYTNFFAPAGLRNLPFAPVSGNHDNHVHFGYHFNVPNRNDAFDGASDTEKGRNYYYLYNKILFVVLDTAPYPSSTSSSQANIDRFRATLTQAKTDYAGKYDWLIVQHHKSTASVGDHLADRDIQYYVEAGFEKIMSDENVDFVLAGHDHVYARSYPLDGRDGGKVSVPDKVSGTDKTIGTKTYKKGSYSTSPGKPIYLTFTTGSGLKYYAVSSDPTFNYNNTLYVKDNAVYPYLGEITEGDGSSQFGSIPYKDGVNGVRYLPVSNAAYVQPYIPSYCIVEVNGRTIKFSTYAITTKTGRSPGAAEDYSFDESVPYDYVEVTK